MDASAAAAGSPAVAEGAESAAAPPPGDYSIEANEGDLSLIKDEAGPGQTNPVSSAAYSAEVTSSPDQQATTPEQAGGKAGKINVSAYEDLLRENMELRSSVSTLQQGAQDALSDKQRLENELRDLERQVAESVMLIQQLRQGDGAAGSAPVQVETDAQIQQLQAEKGALEKQLEAARAQLAAMPVAAAPAPQEGSDLFRTLQEENAQLKKQLGEAEGARQAAAADVQALHEQQAKEATGAAEAQGRELTLKADLDAANAKLAQTQKALDKLLERVPAMEKELAQLRDTVDVKDRDLGAKAHDLDAMKLEMEKREQRLIKAERMSALMEKTRTEVQQVNKKEQRDLHYNMAAVYSKEGRHREAEQEYLKALVVDPTDAGSHYNLGILYEDVFGDRRRAAMHYRAYLKLAPNSEDVDQVKSWLLQMDME